MEAGPDPLNETSGSFVVNEVKDLLLARLNLLVTGLNLLVTRLNSLARGLSSLVLEAMLLVCNNFNQLES